MMGDVVEQIIEILETALAEKNWELVITAIQLLNKIPNEPSLNTGDDIDEDGWDEV